ncbi:T6SS immunity protein Tli3 family protein [Janthinobacterium agaricidamnosum]|uniref:Putative lipoprotein n=1 Tax=Janthinobacterium agaricidamnosum NBRC 102515 = DSM 9628 TaxID=1349767 RepID=W0VEZ0_9BURK|nr:hypothetical protein [Janthinobacterium agaricidamnosum]CDG86013.1 putative lipoprotein [Janthinobacterium agaricidamnosum NBRC 102515 = DSM 9628]
MTRTMSLVVFAALLAACTGQSAHVRYSGQVAAPQVAYRIDGNRYFEVVPLENMACARARLYYTDQARGIHTDVASWDRVSDGAFVIDAANDQYLVAPIIVSSSGCQTGDGASFTCTSRLPYSTDAGRTWKLHISRWTGGGDVYMARSEVYYAGARSSVQALTEGYEDKIWSEGVLSNFPKPTGQPIDTRFHCNSNGMK